MFVVKLCRRVDIHYQVSINYYDNNYNKVVNILITVVYD